MICVQALQPTQTFSGYILPCVNDVAGEVGIGESHAAGADQRHEALGLVGGPDVGEERPQPAIARADEGDIREFLLDLAGDLDEPCHAGQRMLRLGVSAHDRLIERPAHVRIVVGIRDGDVDELDAALAQQADQLLRLGQVGLGVVVLVHAPAVGVGDRVVDAHAGDDAGLVAELRADAVDHLQHESGPVLERAAVLAGPVVTGQQLVDEIAVAGLDVHGVEADLERDSCRLDVGVLELVEVFIRDDGPVVRDLALSIRCPAWAAASSGRGRGRAPG